MPRITKHDLNHNHGVRHTPHNAYGVPLITQDETRHATCRVPRGDLGNACYLRPNANKQQYLRLPSPCRETFCHLSTCQRTLLALVIDQCNVRSTQQPAANFRSSRAVVSPIREARQAAELCPSQPHSALPCSP